MQRIDDADDVEMILKTEKESQSGLFTNERLLLIKAGVISYFSNIPKQFTGSYRTIQLSGQMPKFTIPANQIAKVQLNDKNELSFLILKQRLIAREEFSKMVKGNQELIDKRVSKVAKPDSNSYEQWIFKSSNKEQLTEFYRLVKLFQGNSKFEPKLTSMVEGFQPQKKPRKQTIDPKREPKIDGNASNRRSEVPQPPEKQPMLPVIIPVPQPEKQPQPEPDPKSASQILMQEEQESEQQRLLKVIGKIATQNQPILEIIDQRTNEDRNSDLSKPKESMVEVIKTFEESQQKERKEEILQIVEENTSTAEKQSNQDYRQMEKSSSIPLSLSESEGRISFEVIQRKQIKMNQLLKVCSLQSQYDYRAVADSLGMTEEELVEFISVNSIEQDCTWNFIESQLGKILTNCNTLGNGYIHEQIGPISNSLIEKYHNFQGVIDNSKVKQHQLLEGQISFQNYAAHQEKQLQILQWIQAKMKEQNPKEYTSKIIARSMYKIGIRPISFNPKSIIHFQGPWIINIQGHLEEFLAYLSLEKTIKGIMSKQKGSLLLECGDVIYLKYREYEAIVKQLRVGYCYYPLKSMRCLQFVSRSKDIAQFMKCYPQFTISVEVIKEGQVYRLHLQRIACPSFRLTPLKAQLQRLMFSFDNELDLFFQSEDFSQMQQKCLRLIDEILAKSKRITQNSLYQILQKVQSNIQVDIICKLLGARIDKKTAVYFHPTALRLGTQFGEEIGLIRKARKKGQVEFGQTLSKKLLSKIQFYKMVTPTFNFVQIYLQIIDLLIIDKGELHKAVPVLLKVLNYLSPYEIQQYQVYLSLMRTYLKLQQVSNFHKILQNCRLFLSKMFKQNALIFDFPFIRIITIMAVDHQPEKGLAIAGDLISSVRQNGAISLQLKQKYLSKAIWDRCCILLLMEKHAEAYVDCQSQVLELESCQSAQNHWIEGVLNLGKCWCELDQVNIKNCANIQKRTQRAIELSLARQNFEMVFMLLDMGNKILNRCKEHKMPQLLQNRSAFNEARLEYDKTRQEMLSLIEETE